MRCGMPRCDANKSDGKGKRVHQATAYYKGSDKRQEMAGRTNMQIFAASRVGLPPLSDRKAVHILRFVISCMLYVCPMMSRTVRPLSVAV